MSQESVELVRRYYDAFAQGGFDRLMWDDLTIELGEFVEVDDNVVGFIRERGRSKTGIDMDERHAEVYTLKDGRIVRRRGFSNPSQAIDAARLGE